MLETTSGVRLFGPDTRASLPYVKIYAVGVCDGRLGAGAYGGVIVSDGQRFDLGGWFRLATARRMRLFCVVQAVYLLRDRCVANVFTDSVDAARVFRDGTYDVWRDNSFQGVENADLWERLGRLMEGRDIRFHLARNAHNSQSADASRAAEIAADNLRLALDASDELNPSDDAVDKGYEFNLDPAGVDVGGRDWRLGIINRTR